MCRLSEENFQQLLTLLHEIQDEDLTRSFLSKVGGDLTSRCLNWEVLQYLLQQSSDQTITVNLRKNCFLQESVTRLFPFLDRIVFKRWSNSFSPFIGHTHKVVFHVIIVYVLLWLLFHHQFVHCLTRQSVMVNTLYAFRPSPSFVLTVIREICQAQARHIIPSFLRSLDHVINLTCRELDSVDCAALLFILQHSDNRVQVNLLWTSILTEEIESIIFTLDRVSQLRSDISAHF